MTSFQDYVEGIDAVNRPLFDRVHRLIVEVRPDAAPGLSYGMPTYVAGERRLHVGVWRHGVSLYGWTEAGAAGFLARHRAARTSKGTIRIRRDDTAVTDDDLRELIHAALDG